MVHRHTGNQVKGQRGKRKGAQSGGCTGWTDRRAPRQEGAQTGGCTDGRVDKGCKDGRVHKRWVHSQEGGPRVQGWESARMGECTNGGCTVGRVDGMGEEYRRRL